MKLINLRFSDGENPPIDRPVLVDVPDADYKEFRDALIDSFASYVEHVLDPGSNHAAIEETVNTVMNACDRRWMPVLLDTILI